MVLKERGVYSLPSGRIGEEMKWDDEDPVRREWNAWGEAFLTQTSVREETGWPPEPKAGANPLRSGSH